MVGRRKERRGGRRERRIDSARARARGREERKGEREDQASFTNTEPHTISNPPPPILFATTAVNERHVRLHKSVFSPFDNPLCHGNDEIFNRRVGINPTVTRLVVAQRQNPRTAAAAAAAFRSRSSTDSAAAERSSLTVAREEREAAFDERVKRKQHTQNMSKNHA